MSDKIETQQTPETQKSVWEELTVFFDSLRYVVVDRNTGKNKLTLINDALASASKHKVSDASPDKKKS